MKIFKKFNFSFYNSFNWVIVCLKTDSTKEKLEIRLFKITQDVNDPVMNDYIQENIEQVFTQVDAIGTYGKSSLNWPSVTFS